MHIKFLQNFLQYKAGDVVQNNTDDTGLKMALAQGVAERVMGFEAPAKEEQKSDAEVLAKPADTSASKPKERKVSKPKEQK